MITEVAFRRDIEACDPRFKVFHELMRRKVHEVLLVSTPYDAWIMEEDGRLAEELVHEYRGLNLSSPPRLRWAADREEAMAAMDRHAFDLAILVMGGSVPEEPGWLGELRVRRPELPIVRLVHRWRPEPGGPSCRVLPSALNRVFVWRGHRDLLVAVIKSVEDALNAAHDTKLAGIRIIIVVEDSPEHLSSILPILYKQIVAQTQAVIEQGLNDEHRLLAMRARPKILVAVDYEEAMALYRKYEPCVLGVLSDVRFPRHGEPDAQAGIDFLSHVKADRFDIPLLLMSSEPANAERAAKIPAAFVDKNAPDLIARVRGFMEERFGFGDFLFREAEGGRVLARARNLRELANCIERIPADSFVMHARRNDFSRWLYARAEAELANRLRPLRSGDFASPAAFREILAGIIRERLRQREHGLVVDFDPESFDGQFEFLRIGEGSMGGKARGLAFVSARLLCDPSLGETLGDVELRIPPSLALGTALFEEFITHNGLDHLAHRDLPDGEIARQFLAAPLPEPLRDQLRIVLDKVRCPLAVRSSGLLEDGPFVAYAGLYRTVMLGNNHPDPEVRLRRLEDAVRLVYASTYGRGPRAFARRVGHRLAEERMAVLIQRLAGRRYGGWFHPAVSGVAQSVNYYPFGRMQAGDGVATIAAGLGMAVAEGGKAWRFSPGAPEAQPQHASPRDVLDTVQQEFYSLPLEAADRKSAGGVLPRPLSEAIDEEPFRRLASTYVPAEDRIRDTADADGTRLMTFAPLLKYGLVDLPGILRELLDRGRRGMGGPVEIEFALDLPPAGAESKPVFSILQLRPMSARRELRRVEIRKEDLRAAVCTGSHALGSGVFNDLREIVFVDPKGFDPSRTREIPPHISEINARLAAEGRGYVLIGPGRWGSADPCLGIPVQWPQISAVAAIVEARHDQLTADPSQGSHFFHNLTSLGIPYFAQGADDHIDWEWLRAQPRTAEIGGVIAVRPDTPLRLEVDGRGGRAVLRRT